MKTDHQVLRKSASKGTSRTGKWTSPRGRVGLGEGGFLLRQPRGDLLGVKWGLAAKGGDEAVGSKLGEVRLSFHPTQIINWLLIKQLRKFCERKNITIISGIKGTPSKNFFLNCDPNDIEKQCSGNRKFNAG